MNPGRLPLRHDAAIIRRLRWPWSRDAVIVAVAVGWIALGLAFEQTGGIGLQRAIGAATWIVLFGLLRGESTGVRSQVIALVAVATFAECVASLVLGLYIYRLDNIPAFVPPGHGVVYLAAVALGRRIRAHREVRRAALAALMLGGLWVLWSMTLSARPDAIGAVLFVLFAGYIVAGRAPELYTAAFFLTGCLEILGTALGNWTWAPTTPLVLASMGNPPSGVAGAYCLLDAAALLTAPAASRLLSRLRPA